MNGQIFSVVHVCDFYGNFLNLRDVFLNILRLSHDTNLYISIYSKY